MSAPMKKPLTEIQVRMGRNFWKYSRVPSSRLKPVLTLLENYKDQPVSWREAAKHRMSMAGGEGAYMLKSGRQMAGITQVQLAKKLGMPQGNISQIESGHRPIGKKLAKKLSEIFNLDYRVFL